MAYLRSQLEVQRIRAGVVQKALAALYTATLLFIASSLAIALVTAFDPQDCGWIPAAVALTGGLFLFAASALLLYESRYNLTFIRQHIDFIAFLHERAEAKNRDGAQ